MNRNPLGFRAIGLAGTAAIATSALVASPSFALIPVNTELVLSVDVSGSINTSEFNLQRDGYVNAFRDAELIGLITGLEHGIAVTLQYWSTTPSTSLGWYHIVDAASANSFADAIAAASRPDGFYTNIAAAIDSAANLLSTNNFEGDRKVIDISGDGLQNVNVAATERCFSVCADLVANARDAAVAEGITINGLPILTDEPDLDDYFLNYAIGGEESFLQVAATFSDFETAVKAKIKREIDPEPDPEPVPEPSLTLGLLLGLLGGGTLVKKRRDRAIGCDRN